MTWKTMLAGTTALALIGSSLAFAQQQSTDTSAAQQSMPSGAASSATGATDQGGSTAAPERREYGRAMDHDSAPGTESRRGGGQGDMASRLDRGIARFKDAMRLSPDQEKNWPAFEAAARDFVRMRLAQVEARREQPRPTSPVEQLRRGSDALATTGAALKRLADAEEPLYNSLDDGQKARFAQLSRMARQRFAMMVRGEMRGDRSDMRGDDEGMRGHGGMRGERFGWRFRDGDNDGGGWGEHRGMRRFGRGDDDDYGFGDRRYGGMDRWRGEDRGWRGDCRDDEHGCGPRHHHRHFNRDRDDDDRGWGGRDRRGMMQGPNHDETTGSGEDWQRRDFDRRDLRDDDRRGGDDRRDMRPSDDDDDDFNL